MNRILVIGGTGNIGSKVIAKLTSAGADIRALVREPEMADMPPQVEVFGGDLTSPDSLVKPLQEVETVFLVWTAGPECIAPALQLITSRVKRIVYLSVPIKTPHPFFQASLPNPMSLMHEEIENLIVESGTEYTFLRPGMFASNAIGWWAPQIQKGDLVRWPYLDAQTAPIDELDVASVAVRTLQETGHSGAEYVLTGPRSLSQFDQLSAIGQAIGRKLTIEEITPDEAENNWNPSWPVSIRNMLLRSWAAAIGQPAYVTNSVEEVTGTPPRGYSDWASDHAHEFQLCKTSPSTK